MDDGQDSYRRFLAGDRNAFDEIMQAYFRSLVFFLNRYVHDVHTAEDLAIDAFSELIVHPHRYRFNVSLKTYLFMLGKSRALDHLRHHKKIAFTDWSREEERAAEEKTLEEIVLSDERKKKVNAAVAHLPEEMRTAVHLVYFEELSYDEAAQVMKKNRKQVDNLLYRAKKELRLWLKEEGGDPV